MATQNDSLSLPDFEDRLWDELSQLHGRAPGPAEPEGRSPKRRYLVAAAVVALAGVGVTGALLTAGDSSGPTDVAASPEDSTTEVPAENGGSPAGNPSPDSNGPPDAVFFQEQINTSGRVDRMWADEATGLVRMLQLDANGNPVLDGNWITVENSDGSATTRQITMDYGKGECSETEMTVPAGQGPPTRDNWREDDRIRSQIDKGNYVEDGLEVVDERELLRLVDALGGQADLDLGVTWVDPETYRPVKRAGYPGDAYEGAGYTHTYEFLERTPENLELLEPEVPDGVVCEFSELEPPEPVDVEYRDLEDATWSTTVAELIAEQVAGEDG